MNGSKMDTNPSPDGFGAMPSDLQGAARRLLPAHVTEL